jgi:ribosomal protein S18 acetylase RimI-like enzyme
MSSNGTSAAPTIRAYEDRDCDDLVRRWHETNLVSYRYVALHQKYSLDDARAFFRTKLAPVCRIWVADRAGALLGLIALQVPWIRQFAVFPEFQRNGVGSALLAKARECSPLELRLYTFRRNDAARAFYERNGFSAVAFGVSPYPELEPDVEYRWIA